MEHVSIVSLKNLYAVFFYHKNVTFKRLKIHDISYDVTIPYAGEFVEDFI